MLDDPTKTFYGTVAGAVISTGTGTVILGITLSSLPWIIVGVVLTVGGVAVLIAALAGWWLPGRSSVAERLADKAAALSVEIMQWIGDRRRDEPPHDFDIPFARRVEVSQRHSTETMVRWNERFGVQALSTLNRALELGVGDPSDRFLFEYPTNPHGIEEVARKLGLIANELRQR